MDHCCCCTCQVAVACNCDQWLDTMGAHGYNKHQEARFVVIMAGDPLMAARLGLYYYPPSSSLWLPQHHG